MANVLLLGDVLEARVYCRDGQRSQIAINVSHWVVGTVLGTATTDDDAVDEMDTTLGPQYRAAMSAAAQYYGVQLQRISPLPVSLPVEDHTNRGAGTSASDQLPAQCCGLLTLRTVNAGRSQRGRKYLPFPGEASSDANGLPNAGYVTVANALGATYSQHMTVANAAATGSVELVPVIWHRVPRNYDPIVAYTIRSAWATQMRRGDLRRGDSLPF